MKCPIKVAAWSGVIAIILSIVLSLLGQIFVILGLSYRFSIFIYLVSGVVSAILWILFIHGFVILGKKYESNFLRIISWIGIATIILGIIVMVPFQSEILSFSERYIDFSLDDFSNLSVQESAQFRSDMLVILKFLLIFYLLTSIVVGALSILGGIALFKIRKKVKYAKTAGILKIVAGATYIIFIGFIIRIVAYIFEIKMMFEASKKLERPDNAVSDRLNKV